MERNLADAEAHVLAIMPSLCSVDTITLTMRQDGLEMRMFAAVSEESLQRLEDFNPQELSNLLIAFARMEIEDVSLLDVSSYLLLS